MNEKRENLLRFLAEQSIPYTLTEHAAAYTVADMDAMDFANAPICKNLFLRDKKKHHYFLLSMQKDKRADLKALATPLGVASLHFGSEEDLLRLLGLTTGAVSPCGLLNDTAGIVSFWLDEELLAYPTIGVHPNDNTATIWLSGSDLQRFVQATGHEVQTLALTTGTK